MPRTRWLMGPAHVPLHPKMPGVGHCPADPLSPRGGDPAQFWCSLLAHLWLLFPLVSWEDQSQTVEHGVNSFSVLASSCFHMWRRTKKSAYSGFVSNYDFFSFLLHFPLTFIRLVRFYTWVGARWSRFKAGHRTLQLSQFL